MCVAMPITETKFKLRSPLRKMAPMTSASDYGAQRSCPKGLRASGPTGLEPISQVPTRPTLHLSISFYREPLWLSVPSN